MGLENISPCGHKSQVTQEHPLGTATKIRVPIRVMSSLCRIGVRKTIKMMSARLYPQSVFSRFLNVCLFTLALCLSWMQSLLTFKTRCFNVLSGRRWGLVSPPSHFKIFSFSLTWYARAQCFVHFMFFKGCCSISSTDSVHLWKEVSSGSFYTVILNYNFHSYVKQVKIWVL